ncbi:MAG: ABC transporter permease, partial [Akkermansia sp.]
MRRALLLTVKEFRQVGRDPSALLLAFVIPVLMMLLFGFCLNLDAPVTPVALVVQDTGEPALRLRQQVEGSPYFRTRLYRSEAAAVEALRRGKAQAALLIPADCSRALQRGESPRVAALTDGCVPNTAQFAANYLQSLVQAWAAEQVGADAAISLRRSCRYNPAALSRHYLLPSSITMVLSFVATFLTAMVVAREWERGT